MSSVIILVYGENRHLVPKPADYDGLVDVAYTKFPEICDVDGDSIAFHFTPEWFDGEVKLDRNAFTEVHNRAVLRITTPSALAQYPHASSWDQYPGSPWWGQYSGASSLAQYSGNDGDIQGGAVADQHSDHRPPYRAMNVCVIHVPTDRKVWLKVLPHTRMCRLMARAAAHAGVDQFDYDFEYQGQILEDDDTAQSKGMENGDVIEMWSWA